MRVSVPAVRVELPPSQGQWGPPGQGGPLQQGDVHEEARSSDERNDRRLAHLGQAAQAPDSGGARRRDLLESHDDARRRPAALTLVGAAAASAQTMPGAAREQGRATPGTQQHD